MVKKTLPLAKRWGYLSVGIFAMLFSGVLYAWSILKIPFKSIFGWSDSALAFNFTLTMCFFCIGAFVGSLICKRIGLKFTLILAALLVGIGFSFTGFLNANMLTLLYFSYAILSGTGIGISYNVIISSVTRWFPDRKGLCSGCLMMGFGISTLILGKVISLMFENSAIGWEKTYIFLGIAIAVALVIAAFALRLPGADVVFPEAKVKKSKIKENFELRDFSTLQMISTFTYWRAFVYIAFIAAVGNSVISFARDLVLSVGAAPAVATTLVGVLAVCNGMGRIITGAVYDSLGRRVAMISSNIITIAAAGIVLLAVQMNSLPLCIVGLCFTGLSYGSCPTVSSAFTASFYGQKNFSVNYSITNFHLIGSSFIATLCSSLLISSGGFVVPFIVLLSLSVAALALNFSIRKP